MISPDWRKGILQGKYSKTGEKNEREETYSKLYI